MRASDGKDESTKLKELINLTSFIIEHMPARIQKPYADMLLTWESDKSNFFLVFAVCVVCKVVILALDEVSFMGYI